MIIATGLDISADLTELGRTPIAVVSAGVKSILDIGRTLEFLVSILKSFSKTTRFHISACTSDSQICAISIFSII